MPDSQSTEASSFPSNPLATMVSKSDHVESVPRLRAMVKHLARRLSERDRRNERYGRIFSRSTKLVEQLNQSIVQMEIKHRDSAALVQSLFARSTDVMMLIRRDGTCIQSNDAARRLIGLPTGTPNEPPTEFNVLEWLDQDQQWTPELLTELSQKVNPSRNAASDDAIVSRQVQLPSSTDPKWIEFDFIDCRWEGCDSMLLIGRDNSAPGSASQPPGIGNEISSHSGNSNHSVLDDLKQAVGANELTLAYQPKFTYQPKSDPATFDPTAAEMVGCEALVRWNRNGMNMSPAEFIEIAEESGLIHQLGEQIIELAMRQARVWKEQGVLTGKMGINLSAAQLCDPTLFERFARLLQRTDTSAEWFELEVAEESLINNMVVALDQMTRLGQLGVTFAVDDAGVAGSSLTYIRSLPSLPIATLKIDISLVQRLPIDDQAVEVSQSILSLGQQGKLKIEAVGVETEEQLEFLQQRGCSAVQGFLFSEALSPESLEVLSSQRPLIGSP